MNWKKLYSLLHLTVVHFIKGNIASFASALTYNTLLASVPVLAIAFAIARGFGFDEMVESKIHQVLDFSPETANLVINFVNSYLQHTKGGVFVGVGIAVLMYTVVNLTINIETAFNQIWRVKSSRSLYRQISDYISVFILMPLLFIITSGLSVLLMTFAQMFGDMLLITNTVHWMLYLSPYIITSFSFIFLYKLMPNTQVKWRYCIVPGILAAILFQGMAYFYVHYQIKISSYNAIYGSFAAIPLFLLFVQISWYICLFGGQVCHTCQLTAGAPAAEVHETTEESREIQSQLSAINEQLSALNKQVSELNERLS
jgi:membrane protein